MRIVTFLVVILAAGTLSIVSILSYKDLSFRVSELQGVVTRLEAKVQREGLPRIYVKNASIYPVDGDIVVEEMKVK